MKKKVGTVCIILGIALIIGALSLFMYNQLEAKKAEKSAEKILPQVVEAIEGNIENIPDPYDPTMTAEEIDGYNYIGYLAIPDLGLKLPIMEEWDYTRLKIAPCRYFGSTKTNDLVLAAHNYLWHFGKLSRLKLGAEMIFTDMDGVSKHYAVEDVYVASPYVIEEVTSGEYDLTLFTCTYGGRSRVIVRCMEVKN